MSEDIHSLLGRYFNHQVSDEEENTVRQWIGENDHNAAEFNLLQQLWNKSGEQQPLVFDTQKAWLSIDQKIRVSVKKTTPVRSLYRMAAGIAASVAIVCSIWWLAGNRSEVNNVTAHEAVQQIVLSDGSKIYLRKGSTFSYPEKFKGTREVSLNGEAFFDIVRDASRTFIITAANAKIEVIGTSFSVKTQENQVELIVKTGRVNFGPKDRPGDKIMVTEGERALYVNNELTKKDHSDPNFNAWQSGQLIFDNATLKNVTDALGRYYNVNITFKKEDSATLSAATVTNTFTNQSLSAALDDLSLITSFRIRKINDSYYEISIK